MRSAYIDARQRIVINYVINPKLANSASLWSGTLPSGNRVAVTDLYGAAWGYGGTPSATTARGWIQQTSGQTGYGVGDRITCSMWFKGAVGASYRIAHGNTSGTMLESSSFTGTGGWQRVSVQALGQATSRVEIRLLDAVGIGVPMVMTKAMISPGWDDLPVYCDGDTPGWRWYSTANGSTSLGAPYTLDSITGPSLLEIYGAGTVVRTDKLGLTDDRTVLGVFEVLTPGNTLAYPAITNFNNSADAQQALRTYGHMAADGVQRLFGRVQSTGSLVSDYTLSPGFRTPGRHLAIHGSGGGMAYQKFAATKADGSVVYGSASGFAADRQHQANRLISANSVDISMIWQAAYAGELPDAGRTAAMRWLANAFGAALV